MCTFVKRAGMVMALAALLLLAGCAPGQNGPRVEAKQVAGAVVQVAASAPALGRQLDEIYAFWAGKKMLPDYTAEATRVLAALDAIAPMVQQGAAALQGDNINWVQFVMQTALTAAQVYGYVAPLL